MSLQIHQREPGGVPDFIGEPFAGFNLRFGQRDIGVRRASVCQRESERIGAVGGNRLQRFNAIPLRFAHLLSLFIGDEAVEIDSPERHFVHTCKSKHYHARHPEKEDVPACHQHRSRIKSVELRSLFGPPHRGKRPEAGAEPHV